MSPEAIKKHYITTQEILTNIAGILFIIPLAPFLCRFIPPVFIGDWNVDLIIALIISVIIIRLMQWLVKPLIIPAFLVVCAILIYNQFNSNYTFTNIASGYKAIVNQNWNVREQKQTDQLSFDPHLFENPEKKVTRLVKEKMQYKDSVVRNFAVKHSLENFDEFNYKYQRLTRYFSLFKYINTNFKYVPDAQRDEYYATPRETILNGLGGDCDDHSILMAASLMSIGAMCRLVIIEGHMYPEMYIGDKKDFEIAQAAIIQFFGDDKIDRIYYHENDGEYWVNLDYTASYPGGPYMNDKVKLVIAFP
ncbi:transglutaminase domain-containing protein [Panacibacter ginsenosidivorans]|uniref:Transglutaminase domain-containing protein n=1 Tax=Panacibacter ginsenosidivorans TaxID=1813871 RepID=A0A5B8V963_9BACT|nr:transglutaminase domain-containing protein [Panacibacter ginsenosidivorans]QEC67256.1 transglutaminase domain-containing protein [Panacibacter ginsenosidivorans]